MISPVDGTWDLVIETPIGTQRATVELSTADGVLRGVARDPRHGGQVPLGSGSARRPPATPGHLPTRRTEMGSQSTSAYDRPTGDVPPPSVGMLMYNGQTNLDFIGPETTFSAAGMTVHLISDSLEPVVSDSGVAVLPTVTMADCPAELDILFVPGGMVDGVLLDRARLAFLADRGATASYVTSVCSGSVVLAAAGLLDGYRAATHWAMREQLARFGVEVSEERVCLDRNRCTGGGVTAGIDFGLTLIARVLGEQVARFTQLAIEYDPRPPFDSGSPSSAGPEAVARFRTFVGPADQLMDDAVSQALARRAATLSALPGTP
ncbi:MAG TPA: DJ-1/PfpI family protein [Pseudonocardia sp.]|nr:DJ-1/PfpI family protein [Pseudonocardia sp.]